MGRNGGVRLGGTTRSARAGSAFRPLTTLGRKSMRPQPSSTKKKLMVMTLWVGTAAFAQEEQCDPPQREARSVRR